jgi:hypothetical protein
VPFAQGGATVRRRLCLSGRVACEVEWSRTSISSCRSAFESVALALLDDQFLGAGLGDQPMDLGRFDADRLCELGGASTGIGPDRGEELLATLAACGASARFGSAAGPAFRFRRNRGGTSRRAAGAAAVRRGSLPRTLPGHGEVDRPPSRSRQDETGSIGGHRRSHSTLSFLLGGPAASP